MMSFLFWFAYIFYAFILSYLVLGFIVSFEIVLAMSGAEGAFKWLQEHFSYEELYWSVIFFYPMVKLGYFFLEYLPSFITHEIRCQFSLDALFDELFTNR